MLELFGVDSPSWLFHASTMREVVLLVSRESHAQVTAFGGKVKPLANTIPAYSLILVFLLSRTAINTSPCLKIFSHKDVLHYLKIDLSSS